MSGTTKPIKVLKNVDTAPRNEIKSESAGDLIVRLENRFRSSRHNDDKSFELLFGLLRDLDRRLSAVEK